MRFKDRYWVKTLKWYFGKKYFGRPGWRAQYLLDRVARTLRPGDVVIDCGANLGAVTRRLAARGATVYAFEPDPYSFGRLVQAVADLDNVKPIHAAVGDSDGQVELYRSPDFDQRPDDYSIMSSVFASKANVSRDHYNVVDQVDLAAFVERLGRRVRLLKMDIEGAEVPVLEHLIATGAIEKVDTAFVETHETRIPELAGRTAALKVLARTRYAGRLNLDWD